MRCLAGSLVKTLLSQEIFVTSVANSSYAFHEMFSSVQANTELKTLLPQSIIYSSLVRFHVRIAIGHSIKLSFLTSHANATKVDQHANYPRERTALIFDL